MTDRQMQFIANLIADKMAACKDMEEVKEAIRDLREMYARVEKGNDKDNEE